MKTKTLMQIVTGFSALIALLAGIDELLQHNDKGFAIAFVVGMFFTLLFLRVSRIGNTDPRASDFAKKYL